VRFSDLFEAGKDTLVVYSFMFPRSPRDTRPGPTEGETARLPLAETPCSSCTSILDSLDGAAGHLAQRINLAVVAKSDPERIRAFARERGWRNLRLLSSRNNTYNRDYGAETPEGEQRPILNVFVRTGDRFRHSWATELMFAPRDEGQDPRHVDSIWPIWNVLDLTQEGRGTGSSFPALRYEKATDSVRAVPADHAFPHLFEPIRIRNLELRNRIVFGPHGSRLQDGYVPGERNVAYSGARARGGAGLIVLEVVHAMPREPLEAGPYISVYDPRTIDGWKRVVEEVHRHGAKIFQQLAVSGLRHSAADERDPKPLLAPSPVPLAPGGEIPRQMTQSDIDELVECFAAAAERIKEAGFDGIELHAAHGYFLNVWLSPATNRRDDEYGGSNANRARAPIEVSRAVRETVGDGLVVGMRINGADFVPGGITIDDACETAPLLVAEGGLDYLSVSAGVGADFSHVIPPMSQPHGLHLELAERITEVVDVPTIARGRITTPELAERVVASGQASLVAMIRALIADPELPNKAQAGAVDRIRGCVGANDCVRRNTAYIPIGCVYNPDAGNEVRAARRVPARTPRRVLVVGGGPGGCEAARVAAERGHRVTLWERGDGLGGQLTLAVKAPTRAELGGIVRWYERELSHLGVDVALGTEATAERVAAQAPDVVVVATGSVPVVPPAVAGLDGRALDPRAAFADAADPGGRVAVYVESSYLQGLLAADLWASRGRTVTVFTPLETIATDADIGTKAALLRRLGANGVEIRPFHRLAAADGRLRFTHTLTGRESAHEADTLVYDCGSRPDRALEDALRGAGLEVRPVGDCVTTRNVIGATRDGALVGGSI
jgi:2,4-dienoyl-CoA reductase (NADPH2)